MEPQVRDGGVGQASVRIRCQGRYWVAMKRPAEAKPEDFTMVEVTYRYVTKAALLAAMERGDAWKE